MQREHKKEFKRPKLEGALLFQRKRRCRFCVAKQDRVDYKDMNRLAQFLSERGKIISKRISGNCSKHQRVLACAIRRARFLALFPAK